MIDAFTIQILSHRIEILEEQVATLALAHDQLDEEYCRSEESNAVLQDQVNEIPALNASITRLATEAQTANENSAAVNLEAGKLRDDKTVWETKAKSSKNAAAWGFGIAILEAIVIVAAATYWLYLHPGLVP